MANLTLERVSDVTVPDIGDFQDVPIIEVLVKPGDRIAAEDPLVTLESDKATMDVPAPRAGVVKELVVKVGDKVSEGSLILRIEPEGDEAAAEPPKEQLREPPAQEAPAAAKQPQAAAREPQAAAPKLLEVKVPDIGDFSDVPIIEVMVKPGDSVAAEDPLITLESDKATMDVPAPQAGVVKALKVKVGDKVSEGSLILELEPEGAGAPAEQARAPAAPAPAAPPQAEKPPSSRAGQEAAVPIHEMPPPEAPPSGPSAPAYASPSIRRFARELGVDLGRVKGSGPKSRILKEDVQNYVKSELTQPRGRAEAAPSGGGIGLQLLPWPAVDFAKFGPVEPKPLSRIKKISGANLARNWVMIPHVTQFDEADIGELEEFRKATNDANAKQGVKVTMLAFILKACVAALTAFPEFNASLDGDNLILKRYFHIGFAADTPNGLVVPVMRDVDQKGILQIAREMGELSAKAREGKLKPAEMQGGSFTVSSLGGIGGTAFTPIINAPELAILGVSRSAFKPVYRNGAFEPRMMLPLSLSYDHRVIDGAAAARFTAYLSAVLGDIRRVLL